MRVSENPIVHYGALAGAATAIFIFLTTVGISIVPPWETAADAATIRTAQNVDERLLHLDTVFVLEQQLNQQELQYEAVARSPWFQGKDDLLRKLGNDIWNTKQQLRALGVYVQ